MKFTCIRWAINAHDQERIKQLPGISNFVFTRIPEEGEIIVNSYFVDPKTNEPIELVIDQVLTNTARPDELVVVVAHHQ